MVQFLWVPCSGACPTSQPKEETKFCVLLPRRGDGSVKPEECIWFRKQRVPHLGKLLQPEYHSKVNSFEKGPEKGKVLHQVRVVVLPLGPKKPNGLLIVEGSVLGTEAMWSYWQAPMEKSQCRPPGFWSLAVPLAAENSATF